MRWTRIVGAAMTLCLVLAVAACGGGENEKSTADIREELSASLQRGEDSLDEDTADCFADAIIEEVGVQRLREVDVSDEAPVDGRDEDIAAAAIRAADECDLSGLGG